MSAQPLTHKVLIAALGGEGGGVLADWIIAAATRAGLPVQSTSIPGVAQRTGATTYYLEVHGEPFAAVGARRPVLALTPMPADVDVVVASELVEAGRTMQNGFVTARTTLIASTSRVYAIGERTAMADGRFESERVVAAAKELAGRTLLFDAAALARASGAPLNAILFGALIASGVLPLDRAAAEYAIRQAGKAVDSNLQGFAAGFEQANRASAPPTARAPAHAVPPRSAGDFPPATQDIVARGIARLVDYQGERYARLYLDRLRPILRVDEGGAGGDFPLTQETARQLALWMSYEDVIRVADLKTRRERRERIRGELRAKPSDILRVADFLKPGLEELCSVLPARLGSALYGHGCRRGWQHKLNVGMHIYSTSVGGFLLLRLLASLRWWRPYSWRYREEQVRIEQWLEAILRAASRDLELALAIAACGQIIKGYGDTHARAMGSFDLIARTYFNDETTPVPVLTQAIRAALKAAQSDPEGDALQREIAARSASTRARASFAAAAE